MTLKLRGRILRTLLKATPSGVPFCIHGTSGAVSPTADEDVEELGRMSAEHSVGRHTEIITFAIYPSFLNSAREHFHYVSNSFGHNSTTSHAYSVRLLKINEVDALLFSEGHFAEHPNSRATPHCWGTHGEAIQSVCNPVPDFREHRKPSLQPQHTQTQLKKAFLGDTEDYFF